MGFTVLSLLLTEGGWLKLSKDGVELPFKFEAAVWGWGFGESLDAAWMQSTSFIFSCSISINE